MGDIFQKKCGSGKVLLVDDEAAVITISRKMLERIGFTVITAENGAEAVKTFKGMSADLSFVVMDLTMPVMDGAKAYRLMKEVDDNVPIIISSGFSDSHFQERLDDRVAFLNKPYNGAELEQVLVQLGILN